MNTTVTTFRSSIRLIAFSTAVTNGAERIQISAGNTNSAVARSRASPSNPCQPVAVGFASTRPSGVLK